VAITKFKSLKLLVVFVMVNTNFTSAKIYKNKNNKQITLVLKKKEFNDKLLEILNGKRDVKIKFMK
jgi:hypothetical protein